MLDNKKKIIYVTATILAVILLAVGTVFALSTINNKDSDANIQPQTTSEKETVDLLKIEGVKIINTDTDKAKKILLEARAKYVELGDQTGINDVDSQLYYIEHVLKK